MEVDRSPGDFLVGDADESAVRYQVLQERFGAGGLPARIQLQSSMPEAASGTRSVWRLRQVLHAASGLLRERCCDGAQASEARRPLSERLDAYFEVSKRGSTLQTEAWAGCVAFFTMSYSILVNSVLLDKADANAGIAFEAFLTSIALTSAVGSCVAGITANAPVGLQPGLRLNAYFTFGFCQRLSVTLPEALSCSFVSGLMLLVLAQLGVCDWIARMVITDHLKKAVAVSMGIFQALIGFQLMGYVMMQEHALVTLSCSSSAKHHLGQYAPECSTEATILVAGSFCLMACLLVSTRVNGAVLTGIAAVAVGCWYLEPSSRPSKFFSIPTVDAFFILDFSGWLKKEKFLNMVTGSVIMLLIALFDVTGVQYGLYSIAGLLRNGGVPHSVGIISSTGVATMAGALFGASPVVIANESSAGIMEGGRTGFSAVVVAALFTLSAFITPLLDSIPDLAAAAPLILIGAFMMEPSRNIAWGNLRVAIPSFLTILLVPFWIHQGMFVGIALDIMLCLATWLSRGRRLEGMAADTTTSGGDASTGALQKEQRPSTPHSFLSASAGLKEAEKVERAQQLLLDLGPPCTGMRASETWEMALRHALELYIDGVGQHAD
eukprot:TRINITY_DN17064_c0_g2_i1.p1 TRINITY_DN17064_c0_g2~~TRINITY_DN17064_c0_g2_i1.p1  ORF type:complete len:608 (-),score=152.37 TRINITY_DN17064_c0_g2_i1:125-1948(-)